MRKYEKGDLINTLDEFAKQELVYDSRVNKVYSFGWCQSWQFGYVKRGIESHFFYKVKSLKNK